MCNKVRGYLTLVKRLRKRFLPVEDDSVEFFINLVIEFQLKNRLDLSGCGFVFN